VVLWESYDQDGNEQGVFGQRYANTGAAQGAEFQVNTYTMYAQDDVAAAFDAAGNFVVAWESKQDGDNDGVFLRRYSAAGAPLTGEFQVNTYTTKQQENPAVCSDPSGNLAIVWSSDKQDGNERGVFGQRLRFPPAKPTPAVGPAGLALIGVGLLLSGVAAVTLRRRRT
jgi:hypothetical protein